MTDWMRKRARHRLIRQAADAAARAHLTGSELELLANALRPRPRGCPRWIWRLLRRAVLQGHYASLAQQTEPTEEP